MFGKQCRRIRSLADRGMTTESTERNPSANPFKLAIPVAERVQILNVYVLESFFQRPYYIDGASNRSANLKIHQTYGSDGVDVRQDPLQIAVKLSFALETVREAELIDSQILVKVKFVLLYSIDTMDGIDIQTLMPLRSRTAFITLGLIGGNMCNLQQAGWDYRP